MRFGLQVYAFTWPARPQAIGPTDQSVRRGALTFALTAEEVNALDDATAPWRN